MSEVTPTQEADSAEPMEVLDQRTAGTLLRLAREKAGLHVAALAVSMKVPVKKLEALEADRLDLLPDAVFVRALASSVCRNLKMDPTLILSKLPVKDVPRLNASEYGINAPFHAAGESRSLSMPSMLRHPTVLIVALVLLAALAVFVFPELQSASSVEDVSEVQDSVPVVTQSPEVIALPVQAPAAESLTLATDQPAQTNMTVPAALPAAAVSQVVAIPEKVGASSPVAPTNSTGQQVIFRVKGPSWVEVTDAKGAVLMRRNLSEGEAAGTSGALPLSVVVGRADVTEVEVKGKPFSLAAIAKDNVARFEVK